MFIQRLDAAISAADYGFAAIQDLPQGIAASGDVGTLALLFALRLYRQLQEPPPGERSPQPRVIELASTHHVAGGSAIGSRPGMKMKT
jgi:hypothetical protein